MGIDTIILLPMAVLAIFFAYLSIRKYRQEKNDALPKVQLSSSVSAEHAEKGNVITVWGGINPPPDWNEYLAGFKLEARPKILAIRKLLIKENLTRTFANQMANETVFFFPEDGIYIWFTWRAWGDLIQSIENKREGYRQYTN